LKFADDLVLPFDYTEYAVKLSLYLQQLEIKIKSSHLKVNISELYLSISLLKASALAVYEETQLINTLTPQVTVDRLNNRLMLAERYFLFSDSNYTLPGRATNWYRHSIFAPGLFSGYTSQEFPGATDAIKLYNTTVSVEKEIKIIIENIQAVTAILDGTKLV
jgi:N-acetylated-alpha-linked acidic dipeptidase